MPRVELIYDRDCPNVERARKALLRAFSAAGCQPSWTEWEREAPESPSYARHYGSPTILVDGRDVAGTEPLIDAAACRVYRNGNGRLSGVPSVADIAAALSKSAASGL